MATIVNNPGSTTSGNNGFGMILGVIVVLVLAFLFFVYGLPLFQQAATPQVNVPGQIDVNVQGTGK